VLFFKTKAPIEPVSFVQKICSDALESAGSKKTRFVQRLTPMTRMGKATEKGLEEVSKVVLGPSFHQEGITPKKVLDVCLFPPVGRMSRLYATGHIRFQSPCDHSSRQRNAACSLMLLLRNSLPFVQQYATTTY